MLEWMELINCQSHKHSRIHFSPGFTCITGDNMAGKTTILRALYCLAFNPIGYYPKLKRYGKWPTIRACWRGHIIERNKNGYVLDGSPYKAVKGTVPKDIAKILNLDELNFKLIREELFLISMSPGHRARLVNRVSGLDSQEALIGYCKAKIRDYTNDIKMKAHMRTILQSTVSKLTPVLNIEEDIGGIGSNLTRIEALEEDFNYLSDARNRLLEINSELKYSEYVESLEKEMLAAEKVIGKVENQGLEITYLESELDTLREIGETMKCSEVTISLGKLLEEMKELEVEIGKCVEEETCLSERAERVAKIAGLLETKSKEVKEAFEALNELKKMMGQCPLCGSEFKR